MSVHSKPILPLSVAAVNETQRMKALDSPSHLRYDFRMLIHLLKDVWFYISAGGFLASLVLFVFLLGQYRLAVEAEEENAEEPEGPLEPQEKSQEPIADQTEQFKIKPETVEEEPVPALISPEAHEALEAPLTAPIENSAPAVANEETPKINFKEPEPQETFHSNEEIKILNEALNKLTEQINSLERVFVTESRNNLKALEKISALLKEQTEKVSQFNERTALPLAVQPEDIVKKPLETEKEISVAKKIKLKAPKADATIVLKPEEISKEQKEDSALTPQPEQLELSIKEAVPEIKVEPAEEPAEKNKSPLKIKDPKDLDAIDENTLSTRKGPVWPI